MKGPIHHRVALPAVVLVASLLGCDRSPPTPPAPPAPATQATTAPTTAAVVRPPIASFIDFVRARQPRFPTTQPLGYAVKYAEAAKVVVDTPVFLDNRRDLWLTHPDAPPLVDTLAKAADEQTHVVAERVAYVRWSPDDEGKWMPTLVVERPTDAGGGFELVSVVKQGRGSRARYVERRRPLEHRDYVWSRAFDWRDAVAVPRTGGVASVLWVGEAPREVSVALVEPSDAGDNAATTRPTPATTQATVASSTDLTPLMLDDGRGLLAFIPADASGAPANSPVARFVDGAWTTLPPEREGERVIHLVPLLDGSLLRVAQGERPGTVTLGLSLLGVPTVNEGEILALVEQLDHDEQEKRDAAYVALQQYGQGAWPLLERIMDEQPPEAMIRIRQLLKNRITPTLGGMTIMDGRLQVVARQPDRTALLFAPAGVTFPGPEDQTFAVTPAWIVTGPATGIQLLPQRMTAELRPDRTRVQWVNGDWIASDPSRGVRMWVGNDFMSLLPKDQAEFRHVVGVDRALRWLFAKRPAAMGELPAGEELLILDRHLPDPTPRLPAWVWHEPNATMGWDEKGYPGMKAGGAFVLDVKEWRNLEKDKDAFYTDLADARPRPATRPTTGPTTGPTSGPTTQTAHGTPLLVADDGTQYFGGRDELIVVSPAGDETRWPLPANAVGDAGTQPHLVRTGDGRLFLFNQRGRLLRIGPTPGGAEPFEVEAVFTRNIPDVAAPKRLWIDPAGRLCFLADAHELVVLFPDGRVPRPIALLMPGAAEEDW